MVRQFRIFEKYGDSLEININLPNELLNKLLDSMSFIVYKGTKRNEQKHKNYRSLRVKNISGHFNDNILQNKKIVTECLIEIEMTNKDHIEAKYTIKKDFDNIIENSIYVKINDEPIYYMDDENYDINYFIDMISILYKNYIKSQRWKIK